MANFVTKLVSFSANSSVVEIYRLDSRGRTSLTTVNVGMTPRERDPESLERLTKLRPVFAGREVLTISGSPPTSAERAAAIRIVTGARRALRALSSRQIG